MAVVADESSEFTRRQQCIDVLCGYLRLPYDPEQGHSHRTELVTTTTRPAEPPATSIEEQVHQRIRQNDREVRQTIVRIISAHLQPEAPINWSGHDYDFTGVLFEDASFAGATFSGQTTTFDWAPFSSQTTRFGEPTFKAANLFPFESPRAWNNVTFDWDYSGQGDLPECIHPREWPLQVDS
jgi:hypothetical protein